MQLICDGQQSKAEVVETSINEYKEVFVKARRQFATIVASVEEYVHGEGEAQDALRAATRGRGRGRGAARGGRTSNRPPDSDDDAPPGGGGRGGSRGSGRGTRARGARRGTQSRADSRPAKRARTGTCSRPTDPSRDRIDRDDVRMWRASRTPYRGVHVRERRAGVLQVSQTPGRAVRVLRESSEGSSSQEWADGDAPVRPRTSRTRQTQPRTGGRSCTRTNPECFKCGESGHWSNACPKDTGRERTTNGERLRKHTYPECYKCGQSGHWANACPNS